MKRFFYLVMLLTILGSCQKEEINPSANPASIRPDDLVSNQVNQPIFEGNEDIQPLEVEDQGTEKIASSSILNATNASQIPSQMFAVDYKYKTSYQHKLMNYINGFGKCSWTSYVIAASCIIKGNCNWCSYPVNDTKVDQVMNSCKQQAGSYPNGAAITTIQWYCQNQDYNKLSCYQRSTSNNSAGRFEAIKQMLNHLLTKRSPFLVISTSGTKGHYLIVHAIDWRCGGTGSIVYYTDCLTIASNSNTSYYSNIKTMDLSSFLNKMVVAPSMYNMLFIWSNAY